MVSCQGIKQEKSGKNTRTQHCWDISIAISKCFPTLPICCLWLSQKIPVCSYCSPSMCKCEQRHQNSQNERCGSIEKCVRYAYVVGSGVKCWGWVGGRYGGVGVTKLHRVYSSLKMHEWVVTQNVFRENWGVNCVKHKAPIFKHDSKTKKIWKLPRAAASMWAWHMCSYCEERRKDWIWCYIYLYVVKIDGGIYFSLIQILRPLLMLLYIKVFL